MNLQNRRAQISGTGLVIALVILVVCGLVVYYLVSAPFSAKVNEGVRQATTWTNERIQKDPLGYLTWSISEVRRVQDQMKANYIGLSSQQKSASRLRDEAMSKQQAAQRLLDAGKDAYRKADAASQWPATLDGQQYTSDELKGYLLKLSKTQQGLASNADKYNALLTRLNISIKRTNEKIDEASTAESQLKTNLEFVKADQTIKSLDSLRDTVNSVIDVSDILSESGKTLSITDKIEANRGEVIDNAAWEKLMSK